jgi:predicted nucleic acid-binding Zn ribbon protein
MLKSAFSGTVTAFREGCMQQVSTGLEKVVAASLRQLPPAEAALSAWPMVCGSAVAERTRAESFINGILRVTVADLAWKRELQLLAPRYVATINRYVGQRVDRIEFLVQQAVAPTTIGPRIRR